MLLIVIENMLSVADVVKTRIYHSDKPVSGGNYLRETGGTGLWIDATIFGGLNGNNQRTTSYHAQTLKRNQKIESLLKIPPEAFKRLYEEVTPLILQDLLKSRQIARIPNTLYDPSPSFAPPEDLQAKISRDLEDRLEIMGIITVLRILPKG